MCRNEELGREERQKKTARGGSIARERASEGKMKAVPQESQLLPCGGESVGGGGRRGERREGGGWESR